ncbi:hypothetical protein LX15_004211 [Streptoalloteichus tenebrarius]|uniref:Uncharacterized protein n=1 Tax=Streptoalloteichus tenebrarius (strain ATCC 17920 / DSM 40477 / JCM 4838 / CBS 697.72 / NBRC 16177 / NCIMB 11028 / NRRL B-12390 / A12253. 1 / ISP 5477) TaxID=1933 RepID=A0ABT1HY88_STRSD|nr:hypothetical protein [Streptoalloteichus tenebrarius]MCP2260493.1 hypothetical protein [Streptoalloteichus tenebrarius]
MGETPSVDWHDINCHGEVGSYRRVVREVVAESSAEVVALGLPVDPSAGLDAFAETVPDPLAPLHHAGLGWLAEPLGALCAQLGMLVPDRPAAEGALAELKAYADQVRDNATLLTDEEERERFDALAAAIDGTATVVRTSGLLALGTRDFAHDRVTALVGDLVGEGMAAAVSGVPSAEDLRVVARERAAGVGAEIATRIGAMLDALVRQSERLNELNGAITLLSEGIEDGFENSSGNGADADAGPPPERGPE